MPKHCCCSCCFRARLITITERHHSVVLQIWPEQKLQSQKYLGRHGLPWPLIKSAYAYRPRKVQFLELQKTRDLDLDLGQGQGHISVHNTCMSTSIVSRVTVVVERIIADDDDDDNRGVLRISFWRHNIYLRLYTVFQKSFHHLTLCNYVKS